MRIVMGRWFPRSGADGLHEKLRGVKNKQMYFYNSPIAKVKVHVHNQVHCKGAHGDNLWARACILLR